MSVNERINKTWCICNKEHYWAIKRNTDTCYYMDELGKHYLKGKQSDPTGDMVYDSIGMKCPD